MDEKTMVNDILSGIKSDLTAYQTAISETENMQLRQTFPVSLMHSVSLI